MNEQEQTQPVETVEVPSEVTSTETIDTRETEVVAPVELNDGDPIILR